MPQPLARIIDQLKREPSRTGSIVITVFGDAIVPRGGSVWLGTLLQFFEAIDIDSGVVRTAMSRLAGDGWLEREKVGRNSFYRLTQNGRRTFAAATTHIYDSPPSDWTGRFELLLIGRRGGRRDHVRSGPRHGCGLRRQPAKLRGRARDHLSGRVAVGLPNQGGSDTDAKRDQKTSEGARGSVSDRRPLAREPVIFQFGRLKSRVDRGLGGPSACRELGSCRTHRRLPVPD